MSDYLWDKSGSDEEVEGLERLLGGMKYAGEFDEPELESAPWYRGLPGLAVAAAVLLGVGFNLIWTLDRGPVFPVLQLEGTSACGSDAACGLAVGDWLETDADTKAKVTIADIGHMDVSPDSRLRLLNSSSEEHRLELTQGRIDAIVNAPPRLLVVETPGATAVDLGCIYSLEVDDDGGGLLVVSAGYVSLETDALEVLVPAGAEARTHATEGPGLPVFWDAPPVLVEAVRGGDVMEVLDAARPRDTLTLAHALPRVDDAERVRLMDRIEELVPAASVDRERILALDREALAQLNERLEPAWF